MILSHTINFRNNNLNIVVDYDADNHSVEFFNYATITDEKGEVDISDMFTSYLNGEEIMENIDWHRIYVETQNEKNIDYEKDI
jgi:hypothetical protein